MIINVVGNQAPSGMRTASLVFMKTVETGMAGIVENLADQRT